MKLNRETISKVLKLKVMRFAMTGLVATTVDYIIYLILFKNFFNDLTSHAISYSCGMVINFLMHKRYVFTLQGKVSRAFVLSLAVSLGGMAIGGGILRGLNQFDFFYERQYITKLCATGFVFFYNFYLKRYVFERKFI